MDYNTIIYIIEIAALLLPIFASLSRILTLHIANSTKIDLILQYLDKHENRLQELEKLLLDLSKGAGK